MEDENIRIASELSSNIVIEHILSILSKKSKNIIMKFSEVEFDGEKMYKLTISNLKSKEEKHVNLKIPAVYYLNFLKVFLFDILTTFGKYADISLSRYYSVYSDEELFSGIDIENFSGSKIKIDLNCMGEEFDKIISSYTDYYNKILELKGYNINNI